MAGEVGARSYSEADYAAFQKLLIDPGLVKGGRVAANWLPDGRFWFVEGAPTDTSIKVFDPATKQISDLFDVAALRRAFADLVGHEPAFSGLPFEQFHHGPDGLAHFTVANAEYAYNAEKGELSLVPAPGFADVHYGTTATARSTPNMMARPSFFPDVTPVPECTSPNGKRMASLKNGDIYIRSVSDGRYDRLTDDAEEHFGWDVETTRMGLSASGGLVNLTVNPWSPDSNRLYATRFDEREVKPHHRIRYLRQFDEVEAQRMSRSGDVLATTEPFILDINGGQSVRLDVDAKDAFILLVGWTEDGRNVILWRSSRDMREAKVLSIDAATGGATELFSERGETFIRIQHEVIGGRTGCWMLPLGQGFLWESERDGWKHLYHYDAEGNLVRQLTKGDWPMAEVFGLGGDGNVYFSARHDQDRPYDIHICRVPLAGGAVEQLTNEPGLHDAQFAPDYSYFVDTAETQSIAPQSRVLSNSGEVWHEFPAADISALEAAGWTPPEEFCIKAADGETDLHGVMFKPANFDPAKKYPIIEFIYGGPQVTMVPRKFGAVVPSAMGKLNIALPQLGYVCLVVDARGTPGRSKTFQDEVFGNWRRSVTADHAAVLRNLAAERPYLDLDRVGIWGHSWGGYFTTANMFDNPDLYRAGVASAPGFDPYGLFIYEPYLGGVPSPETQAAYDDAWLYSDADKLEGALMMVAGMNDLGVWHSAVTMAHYLIEAGKQHELVTLPNTHHGYGTAQEAYFIKKLVGHFDRYLLRGEAIPS